MGWLLVGLFAILVVACAMDDDDMDGGEGDMFDWTWPSQQRREA